MANVTMFMLHPVCIVPCGRRLSSLVQ